jgi:D-alanine-D-alanine ligase
MAKKLTVGVIFGGRSGEHEVSLMSAASVLAVIDRQKYEIVEIGITPEGKWLVGENVLAAFQNHKVNALVSAAIFGDPTRKGLYQISSTDSLKFLSDLDVIFPVLHGSFGEDGTLQGLFEMSGVAYVGAGVLGSSVGMDKALFKDVMRTWNIPVVDSITVTRSQVESSLSAVLAAAERISAYPLFVKPVNMGSSVGVSKCVNHSDLEEGLLDAARYDRRILIERGLNAREIEISVLGNDNPQASVPGEIRPGADFYSYAAKYELDNSELLIPAPLSTELTTKVQEYAIRAYKAIDCAGMARVDFLLDRENGSLYLNEINTIPGFTKISMYPKLWEATGVSYSDLIDRLINLALERRSENDHTERRYRRDE